MRRSFIIRHAGVTLAGIQSLSVIPAPALAEHPGSCLVCEPG